MIAPPDRGESEDPYGRLFIYYLQGHLARGTMDAAGPHCIGNWEEGGDTFLFFSRPADGEVALWVAQNPDARLVDRYEMSYEQWQGGPLEPFSIGPFHVRPPWVAAAPPPDAVHELVIDPGVVFGAGTHPTTRDCLRALEVVARDGGAHTAIDIGTGTGILAVAAAKMGCRRVLAVDFNHLAVKTASANVRGNGLESRVLPLQGLALDFISVKADLVIANIHFDAMMPALRAFDPAHGRWLVLSGLLRSQVRRIEALLPSLRVEVRDIWEHRQTWFTLLAAVKS